MKRDMRHLLKFVCKLLASRGHEHFVCSSMKSPRWNFDFFPIVSAATDGEQAEEEPSDGINAEISRNNSTMRIPVVQNYKS